MIMPTSQNKFNTILVMIFSTFMAQGAIPHKAVICGVCKDNASRVLHSMRIMEKIGKLFEDYRVIIYENNSSDETPTLVRTWQEENNKVFALTETVTHAELENTIVNRYEDGKFFTPELIARARNIVLEIALSNKYQDFDTVIWIDMDFVIEPNYDAIPEIFKAQREWDAVFAYGVDPYYHYWDWYALRDRKYPMAAELIGKRSSFYKQLILDPLGDWYPVYSAFGGCGIYKKESIRNCHYSALVTDDLARVMANFIQENQSNPMVQQYLKDAQNCNDIIVLKPSVKGYDLTNPEVGIVTTPDQPRIVWRMNSDVFKFPAVCEHVTFHASMIKNGHAKLFINPRLIFHYGDRVR